MAIRAPSFATGRFVSATAAIGVYQLRTQNAAFPYLGAFTALNQAHLAATVFDVGANSEAEISVIYNLAASKIPQRYPT